MFTLFLYDFRWFYTCFVFYIFRHFRNLFYTFLFITFLENSKGRCGRWTISGRRWGILQFFFKSPPARPRSLNAGSNAHSTDLPYLPSLQSSSLLRTCTQGEQRFLRNPLGKSSRPNLSHELGPVLVARSYAPDQTARRPLLVLGSHGTSTFRSCSYQDSLRRSVDNSGRFDRNALYA